MPAANSNKTDYANAPRALRLVPTGEAGIGMPALPRLADGGEHVVAPAPAQTRIRATDALALCLLDCAGGG